ncbi:hypothetical protein GW17_00041160 [Ensete ventricosum]|nr:hypothetical protein GW17_00041160 [Ensete ventricosum]
MVGTIVVVGSRKASVVMTDGTGLATNGENPRSVIILQKMVQSRHDVVTSFALGGWFGSVRCSAFELFDERSCDIGPPSSAKIFVKNLRACPVGAVYASESAGWARSAPLCWVDHAGDLVVQEHKDVTTRRIFAISVIEFDLARKERDADEN